MNKLITHPHVGENIHRIRKSQKLTQPETIRRINEMGSPLSRGTFSQIEMGTANIFATDLVALSIIFQVDISAFFEGIGTERAPGRK